MPDPVLVSPVVGLPAGPATWATVRNQLGLAADDHLQDESLELAINAVNQFVCRLPIVVDELLAGITPPPDPDYTWRGDVVQGAVLLASRVFSRRNSPEGVAAFGDQGAIYVQRNDPDVAMMLRIGGWAKPAVG